MANLKGLYSLAGVSLCIETLLLSSEFMLENHLVELQKKFKEISGFKEVCDSVLGHIHSYPRCR